MYMYVYIYIYMYTYTYNSEPPTPTRAPDNQFVKNIKLTKLYQKH